MPRRTTSLPCFSFLFLATACAQSFSVIDPTTLNITTIPVSASSAATMTASPSFSIIPPPTPSACDLSANMCPQCDGLNVTSPEGVVYEVACNSYMVAASSDDVGGVISTDVCVEACDNFDCAAINFQPNGSCALCTGDLEYSEYSAGVTNLIPIATYLSTVTLAATTPTPLFDVPAATATCDLSQDNICPACDRQYLQDENGNIYHAYCDNSLYSEGNYAVQEYLTPLGCLAQCDTLDFCEGATHYPGGNCMLAKGQDVFPVPNPGYVAFLPVLLGAPIPPTLFSAFPRSSTLSSAAITNASLTLALSTTLSITLPSTTLAVPTDTTTIVTGVVPINSSTSFNFTVPTLAPIATAPVIVTSSGGTTIPLPTIIATFVPGSINSRFITGFTNASSGFFPPITGTAVSPPISTGSFTECDTRHLACPACDGRTFNDSLNESYAIECGRQISCEEQVPLPASTSLNSCLEACDFDPTCFAAAWNFLSQSCSLCQHGILSQRLTNSSYVLFFPVPIAPNNISTRLSSTTTTYTTASGILLSPTGLFPTASAVFTTDFSPPSYNFTFVPYSGRAPMTSSAPSAYLGLPTGVISGYNPGGPIMNLTSLPPYPIPNSTVPFITPPSGTGLVSSGLIFNLTTSVTSAPSLTIPSSVTAPSLTGPSLSLNASLISNFTFTSVTTPVPSLTGPSLSLNTSVISNLTVSSITTPVPSITGPSLSSNITIPGTLGSLPVSTSLPPVTSISPNISSFTLSTASTPSNITSGISSLSSIASGIVSSILNITSPTLTTSFIPSTGIPSPSQVANITTSTSSLTTSTSSTTTISGFNAVITSVTCPLYDASVVVDPSQDRYFEVVCDLGLSGGTSRLVPASNFSACAGACQDPCDAIQYSSTICSLFTSATALITAPGYTAGLYIPGPVIPVTTLAPPVNASTSISVPTASITTIPTSVSNITITTASASTVLLAFGPPGISSTTSSSS